ncbi:MAG TPA: hypothetical protein VMW89_17585 [Desulfatiglandales bacterium]|nr:hypothetical protein [Desulfatiglandales bacterium]
MKGFVGITDNEWFAFLFTAAIFLPKIARQSAIKTADKKDGG